MLSSGHDTDMVNTILQQLWLLAQDCNGPQLIINQEWVRGPFHPYWTDGSWGRNSNLLQLYNKCWAHQAPGGSFKPMATQMIPDKIRGSQSKPKKCMNVGKNSCKKNGGVTEVGPRSWSIEGWGWTEWTVNLSEIVKRTNLINKMFSKWRNGCFIISP